jgi:Zn-dependent protease
VGTRSGFRVFGFPVVIMPGFLLGLLIIFALNAQDGAFAIRLVVALAVFTLIHELGHALAARRFEADAAISLNFLVGWSSLRPSRPLTRGERIAISAAGPLVEIAVGVVLLVALGFHPLAYDEIRSDPLALAIWWAGPVLGIINLLPLLPLDGGNILATALDVVVPGRAHRLVQWWTMTACIVAAIAVVTSPTWRPWALTVALFALWNLQSFMAERRRSPQGQDAAQRALAAAIHAEETAWREDRPGLYPPPYGPSPWFRAHVLLAAGKDATAKNLLLQSLAQGAGAWVPPTAATSAQLLPLVELLPDPLPVGDLQSGLTLQHALLETGYLRRSADYGARLYEEHPTSAGAQLVARALDLLGYADAAQGWLRAAGGPPPAA